MTPAGTSETFTVTALSPSGGTDTSYVGTVDFTSTDPQAVLPANYPFTAANDGTQTFTVKFKTAGPQAITATDTATPSHHRHQRNHRFRPPPPVAEGHRLSQPGHRRHTEIFTVTALDAYGNVATGYTGTVKFTSSDSQASLPGNYTFTPDDAGTHVFFATLKTGGTQSITATDAATATVTGNDSLTVTSAVLVGQDSTTQGNWIGKYGSDGYNIIGDATSYPSYATVTATGESTTIWSSSTTDPRALENPGGAGRIAATWYSSTSFSINVDLTDGQAHDVALYALDWDDRAAASRSRSPAPPREPCSTPKPSPISPAAFISSGRFQETS